MFDTAEDIQVAIAQGTAIGRALQTTEDKLYWTAGAGLGHSMMFLADDDGNFPPEFIRMCELQNDMFAEVGLTGQVLLSNEYKALVNALLNKLYTEEIYKKMEQAVKDAEELLDGLFDLFNEEEDNP